MGKFTQRHYWIHLNVFVYVYNSCTHTWEERFVCDFFLCFLPRCDAVVRWLLRLGCIIVWCAATVADIVDREIERASGSEGRERGRRESQFTNTYISVYIPSGIRIVHCLPEVFSLVSLIDWQAILHTAKKYKEYIQVSSCNAQSMPECCYSDTQELYTH